VRFGGMAGLVTGRLDPGALFVTTAIAARAARSEAARRVTLFDQRIRFLD
jgi:hypothetical protein